MNLVAFAGGVGGAKLADGLQRVVGDGLTVIINTGDDFELHGLTISPDLDTVMYTLSGVADPETGWGVAGDTYSNLAMMSAYGAPAWFRLGDRDLATHILRTRMLREGRTLSQVTRTLSAALGVAATILPMSDQRVATMVDTNEGELAFQEYFVHRHWKPVVKSVRLAGIEEASPSPGALEAIDNADALVLCPSNPFVSIEPILSLPGMREKVRAAKAPKIAVSPIVGAQAIKGPAAKMFSELGFEPSALAVATRYKGLVDAFMIDKIDESRAAEIRALGMQALVTDVVMWNDMDRERLGREIVDWATVSAAR